MSEQKMDVPAHSIERELTDQQEEQCLCEAPGCTLPGTRCPACEQCFCFQHLLRSSCETCNTLLSRRSFEHQLGRLVSFGVSLLLCGILFLLLPRDENGIIIQLAIAFFIVGILFFWIGLLART
jgi:hypothetical protein